MKKFVIKIEMSVAEIWEDDGFNPKYPEVKRAIENALTNNLLVHSTENEFKVKILEVQEK